MMKRYAWFIMIGTVTAVTGIVATHPIESAAAPKWSMRATLIEGCSCPMFCPCFFNSRPATRFCRFNAAYRVDRGHYGSVSLVGVKFWVAGDLGSDFSQGRFEWVVVTFEPSVVPAQREAIHLILERLYPFKEGAVFFGEDAPIEWYVTTQTAEAKLANGTAAEVILRRSVHGMTQVPMVLHNLKYWGAPRNSGFLLMPNEIEEYRLGEHPFVFKGTTGFVLTIDIASSDIQEQRHGS